MGKISNARGPGDFMEAALPRPVRKGYAFPTALPTTKRRGLASPLLISGHSAVRQSVTAPTAAQPLA